MDTGPVQGIVKPQQVLGGLDINLHHDSEWKIENPFSPQDFLKKSASTHPIKATKNKKLQN